MAGLIAGVIHAPLTAIFLIAEITGGYDLFIPLIITSSISYITSIYFEPHSIYTKQLAAKNQLITHDKDKAILTLLETTSFIEKDLISVHPDNTLRELVEVIAKSKRNIFPVVDNDNYFLGIVSLDNIRNIMFDRNLYDITFVHELMSQPLDVVSIKDSMEKVMNKFQSSGLWNMPVLDNGKYVGFVSKSNVFSAYREKLIEFSEM
jgi:CIC family chloride channel protein